MRYFDVDIRMITNAGDSFDQISDELKELMRKINFICEELEGMGDMEIIRQLLMQKKADTGYYARNAQEYGIACKNIGRKYMDTEDDLVYLAKEMKLYFGQEE